MKIKLNDQQLMVISVNLSVLKEIGCKSAVMGKCNKCSTPCIADSEHGIAVCGYCGEGPFTI